ncbi:uncharacterized protein OCT59_025730 [Rhizophagus irregularis]|nr:hypothetical protein OCT59_025730 [Rhizophagus irregularis]
MADGRIKDKTVRSTIYKEMKPFLLTKITQANLRKKTHRARKHLMLFGKNGIRLDKIKLVLYSATEILKLTNVQIQNVIKKYTSDHQSHMTLIKTVLSGNDQIKTEHAKLSGLPSVLTDKIRSNLCKRYKKETGNEPWQASRAVTNMSTKSQASDFKPITFEVRPDPELIIKSVLEQFPYLKFGNSFRGIDNYNFTSP